MIRVSFNEISYLLPNWNDLDEMCFKICQKIKQKGERFDSIISLAKGGWPMTRTMLDYLGLDKMASIGIKFYKEIEKREIEPVIYQQLPIKIKGEKVLLFDDVADSGESLILAQDYLKNLGAREIKIATIFYKKRSRIKPDYLAELVNEWVIFPFEKRESINLIGKQWRKQGLDKETIISRFEKMGFDKNKIEYFLKIS